MHSAYPRARYRRRAERKEGVFDPTDTAKVSAKRFGVWMLYEQIPEYDFKWQWPGVGKFVRMAGAFQNVEYLARLTGEMLAVSPAHCALYVVACLFSSILPAMSVWLSGQMLTVVSPPRSSFSFAYGRVRFSKQSTRARWTTAGSSTLSWAGGSLVSRTSSATS